MGAPAATATLLSECRGLSVVHGSGPSRVEALREADFGISDGEKVALRGPSGSGKTTLLHALGGLLTPSAGTVSWLGQPLSTLDAAARGRVRAAGIAYIFQSANMLLHLTAFENVAFAIACRGGDDPADPTDLLTLVGLESKLDALPAELSGGEAQRVAIARALGQRPRLLLADEPTGHLDSDTGTRVLDLIDALQEEFGFALLTATHDANVAGRHGRLVDLADGRIVDEKLTG